VDVLTARQLLVAAQTSYAQAKYGYLNNVVALRQAAGNLDRKTVEEINGWLAALPHPGLNPPAGRCARGATVPPRPRRARPRPGGAAGRIAEQRAHRRGQGRRVRHGDQGSASASARAMSGALNWCGPATMGAPSAAGSSRLWPPAHQAPADEGNVGSRVEFLQFTEGIEQHHARLTRDGVPTPECRAQPAARRDHGGGDRVEARRVTWRQHQQRSRMTRRDSPGRLQHWRFSPSRVLPATHRAGPAHSARACRTAPPHPPAPHDRT
jgi:hypothetical protein